jgi:hypothetical protein
MVRRRSRRVPATAGLALLPNRNGGRHCCQPPLRRAKDLPVFVTLLVKSEDPTDRFRSWLTSSGVASCSNTLSEEKLSGLLACAARRPACRSIVQPARRPGIRNFAALLGMTAPAFVWLCRSEDRSSRVALEGRSSLPAPLPDLPLACFRGSTPAACRVEIGPFAPSSRGRLGRPSRSPDDYALRPESLQAKKPGVSLWIAWIARITRGTISDAHKGCRSVLLCLPPRGARIPAFPG